MDAKEFLRLKEKIARLQKERDRAEGALQRVMKEFREKYGIEDLQEAEDRLRKLQSKKEKASARFQKASREFEEKWGDRLQDRGGVN